MTPSQQPSQSFWSFWKRPEGKGALLFNAAIIAVIIIFWGTIVPFLVTAVEDTLKLIVLVSILFTLIAFRHKAWFIYRALMRYLTARFVNMDPIGILKTIQEKFIARKAEFDSAVTEIRGQRVKLNRQLAENAKGFDDCMSQLETAKKQFQTTTDAEVRRRAERIDALQSKQAKRLEALITRQQEHMKTYDFAIAMLTRYGEVCDDNIEDTKNEIGFREQDRASSRSFRKAMRAAVGIFKGTPEDMEMQDMALDALQSDYAACMGEVENALEMTKHAIIKADFNDAAAMEAANATLARWKTQGSATQLTKSGISKESVVADAERSAPSGKRMFDPASDEYREFLK